MSFAEQLKTGLIGEGEIAQKLIAKGYSVLPAYEIEQSSGKGPRLFTEVGRLISPDMLVFNASKVLWVEAKTKSAFTWHRLSGTWQTGIDRRHWEHYLEVFKTTPFPVWILFLHRNGGLAKDTPAGKVCPSGLFGNSIEKLNSSIHHQSKEWGTSGMVYWTISALKQIEI